VKEIDYFAYREFTRSEYNPRFRCGVIEWNVISGYQCEFVCNFVCRI
jgi:hypothetical protein